MGGMPIPGMENTGRIGTISYLLACLYSTTLRRCGSLGGPEAGKRLGPERRFPTTFTDALEEPNQAYRQRNRGVKLFVTAFSTLQARNWLDFVDVIGPYALQ